MNAMEIQGGGQIADGLLALLTTEHRIVEELVEILHVQRQAVAADNLDAVDEASHAMQRALFTLGDARRRRRAIGRMLGRDDVQLPELEEVVGSDLTAELITARERLLSAARMLARDVDSNRRVLRQALSANERHVARITNSPESASYGGSPNQGSSASAGLLINRRG